MPARRKDRSTTISPKANPTSRLLPPTRPPPVEIINAAFLPAADYRDGATTLCFKLAKFCDITADADTCPISAMLFDGPENDAFRAPADRIFASWIACIVDHAIRLGQNPTAATSYAEWLLTGISGSWAVARARRNADALRALPRRLFR